MIGQQEHIDMIATESAEKPWMQIRSKDKLLLLLYSAATRYAQARGCENILQAAAALESAAVRFSGTVTDVCGSCDHSYPCAECPFGATK